MAMTDRIDYEPLEFAEIDIYAGARDELRMSIRGGGEDSEWLEAFPRHGGDLQYRGRLTLDVTDFMACDPCVYSLVVVDGSQPIPGNILDFSIRKADGYTIPCDETPLSLPVGGSRMLTAGLLDEHTSALSALELRGAFAEWADMDCDGDMDFAVCGTLDTTNAVIAVFRNGGDDSFSRVDLPVSALSDGVIRWGDYDRDGYPDLALSGRRWEGLNAFAFSAILRNESGRSFSDPMPLPVQVGNGGAMAWGDYDNDGDPDLALCGYGESSAQTTLLQNMGTNFVVAPVTLTPKSGVAVSWADVDNDGWLDLAVGTQLYRNLGGGAFTNDVRISWGGDFDCHAWADFNGDGLLDVAAYSSGGAPKIYINMGYMFQLGEPDFGIPDAWSLWFLEQDIGLDAGYDGVLVPADFDADGDLDFAYSTSLTDDYSVQAADVARADGEMVYTNIGLHIPGMVDASLSWCDWDEDGDLDLMSIGRGEWNPADPYLPVNRCHRSLMANAPGRATPNNPPVAPDSFSALSTNGAVLLRWNGASDAETHLHGLSYDVRVGTRNGGEDVVTAAASHALQGRTRTLVPLRLPESPMPYQQFLNTNGSPGLLVSGLPSGRYYWSVRARDGGLAISAWSREQSLSMSSVGIRTGDVNGDGRVDVADVVRCRKMVRGTLPDDLVRADMDADGDVTETDASLIVRLLMDMQGRDYLSVARAVIGPGGGVLDGPSFDVVVPAGAFDVAAELELMVSEDDRPFGSDSVAPMYRVHNLPETIRLPLGLKIPDTRGNPDDVSVALVGSYRHAYDDGDNVERRFSGVPAVPDGSGNLVVEINAARGALTRASRSTAPNVPTYVSINDTRYDIYVSWDTTTWARLMGAHFNVYYSVTTSANRNRFFETADTVLNELEAIYTRLQTMGFDMGRLPGKISVWVYDLGKSDNGVLRLADADSDEIRIHSEAGIIESDTMRRSTLAHEFMHVVQYAYGASYAGWKTLWLDEATSIWMEGLLNPVTYASTTYQENNTASFSGMVFSGWPRKPRQDYGYGMGALIAHLVNRQGENILPSFYARVSTGKSAFDAIYGTLPAGHWPEWHYTLYPELLKRKIYAQYPVSILSQVVDPKHTFTVQSDTDRAATYAESANGFGCQVYRTVLNPKYTGLEDDDVLAFKLKGDEKFWFSLMKADNQTVHDTLIEGEMTAPGVYRAVLPDLKAFAEEPKISSVLGLVVRSDKEALESSAAYTMDVGVIKQLDGAQPLLTHVSTNTFYSINDVPLGFPAFRCQGSLSVVNVPGMYRTSLHVPWPGYQTQWAHLIPWVDGAVSAQLNYTATLVKSQFDVPGENGTFTRYQVAGIKRYALTKREYFGPELSQQPLVFDNVTISTTTPLYLLAHEEHVYYVVSVIFDLTVQEFSGAGIPNADPRVLATMASSPLSVHIQRN